MWFCRSLKGANVSGLCFQCTTTKSLELAIPLYLCIFVVAKAHATQTPLRYVKDVPSISELRHSRQSLAGASERMSRSGGCPYPGGPPQQQNNARRQRPRSRNNNLPRPGSRYSLADSTHTLNRDYEESNWTDHDMDIYMARNPTTRGGLVPLWCSDDDRCYCCGCYYCCPGVKFDGTLKLLHYGANFVLVAAVWPALFFGVVRRLTRRFSRCVHEKNSFFLVILSSRSSD